MVRLRFGVRRCCAAFARLATYPHLDCDADPKAAQQRPHSKTWPLVNEPEQSGQYPKPLVNSNLFRISSFPPSVLQ